VVVAFGADKPLALPDQVQRVRRVDTDIGLGVVLDEQRLVGDVLRWEAAGLLPGRRARARRLAAARIAVRRRQRSGIRHFGRVAADALRRSGDVDDTLGRIAGRKRGVRLIAL
jgi:hypothetical protein